MENLLSRQQKHYVSAVMPEIFLDSHILIWERLWQWSCPGEGRIRQPESIKLCHCRNSEQWVLKDSPVYHLSTTILETSRTSASGGHLGRLQCSQAWILLPDLKHQLTALSLAYLGESLLMHYSLTKRIPIPGSSGRCQEGEKLLHGNSDCLDSLGSREGIIRYQI